MSAAENLDGVIESLAKGRDVQSSLHLDLGGVRMEIGVNDPALGLALEQYFAPFRAGPGPCDVTLTALEAPVQTPPMDLIVKERAKGKKPHEAYADLPDGRVVRKFGTDILFVFGGGRNLVIGPCLEHLNQVVNFVGNRLIELLLNRGGLPVHVAAAAKGGLAMAATGVAGKGKSTLALHMTARGADFVTNDRAVFLPGDKGVSIHGEPKMARINPGTALNVPGLESVMPADDQVRFRTMPTAELWTVERKYTVPVGTLFGQGRFSLSARLGGVLFLEWSGFDEPCRIEPASGEERAGLAGLLRKSPGLFFHPEAHVADPEWPIASYVNMLADVPVFTARGGVDFETAANFCLEHLENFSKTD